MVDIDLSRVCIMLKKREREPSRLSKGALRNIQRAVKCRKLRRKYKKILKQSVPASSAIYRLSVDYKAWKIRFIWKQDSFYSHYFAKRRCLVTACYNATQRNLLLSGDIELNPGPVSRALVSNGSHSLLNTRMHRLNLRPLDVGGGGDCFFRAVSHQLYGNAHSEVRAAGVRYLEEHPERFIESNLGPSWIHYITTMSITGTWADNLIVQAVADALKLRIHIIESSERFAEITEIAPANPLEIPRR